MNFRVSLLSTVFVVLTLGLISCDSTGGKKAGKKIEPTPTGNSGSEVGGGFLKTDYEPLLKWLDERFEVKYVAMTPQAVFDQVPLRDIRYETTNLPQNGAPLNFEAPDISRRDLLKKIANHWKLKMSLIESAEGKPSAVRVEG